MKVKNRQHLFVTMENKRVLSFLEREGQHESFWGAGSTPYLVLGGACTKVNTYIKIHQAPHLNLVHLLQVNLHSHFF